MAIEHLWLESAFLGKPEPIPENATGERNDRDPWHLLSSVGQATLGGLRLRILRGQRRRRLGVGRSMGLGSFDGREMLLGLFEENAVEFGGGAV